MLGRGLGPEVTDKKVQLQLWSQSPSSWGRWGWADSSQTVGVQLASAETGLQVDSEGSQGTQDSFH